MLENECRPVIKSVWSEEITSLKEGSRRRAKALASILMLQFNWEMGRYNPHSNLSFPGFSKSDMDAPVSDFGKAPLLIELPNISNRIGVNLMVSCKLTLFFICGMCWSEDLHFN